MADVDSGELPAGITSIGDYAFHGCSSLATIELPAGFPLGDTTRYGFHGEVHRAI